MSIRVLILTSATLLSASVFASEANSEWQIGPEIRGKNYSVGMPAVMSVAHAGPAFDFPTSRQAKVKYITMQTGPLTYARSMTITYRIDASPGTRFIPNEKPGAQAILSLYFQREGDNWSGRGKYSAYRWYSAPEKTVPLSPGQHTLTVDLADDWIPVTGGRMQNMRGFRAALENAEKVGFVMGWSGGRGHGVYATGPARFTLLDFQIR
ncbi:hypothetical protein K3165_06005 [Qipengyuania sp. 1XM1-15A]|uniref:hypothetical protein n=1 Tax=Qipengyuania xiamenensis TaxID=2867237 RepID=UPI001C87912A|nr:hypothetical protein [Qipengyuania xiamenensis]MBX7532471.1 hypothetical protein [Qipengyuania xiamenensis]